MGEHIFHSRKEARRYEELLLLERAGKIKGLVLQPKFMLQEAFTDNVGGKHQAIHYIADFSYTDTEKNCEIVEDVKGCRTPEFNIKLKLFLHKYTEPKFFLI